MISRIVSAAASHLRRSQLTASITRMQRSLSLVSVPACQTRTVTRSSRPRTKLGDLRILLRQARMAWACRRYCQPPGQHMVNRDDRAACVHRSSSSNISSNRLPGPPSWRRNSIAAVAPLTAYAATHHRGCMDVPSMRLFVSTPARFEASTTFWT
eukprot:COSAG01_NODE_2277_length_8010_cov_15.062571_2_plen_155_part_00